MQEDENELYPDSFPDENLFPYLDEESPEELPTELGEDIENRLSEIRESNLESEEIIVQRPIYRVVQCCQNCIFFRKMSPRIIGYCRVGEYQYVDSKNYTKEERQKIYWKPTRIDTVCDLHIYKGRRYLERAQRVTGAEI